MSHHVHDPSLILNQLTFLLCLLSKVRLLLITTFDSHHAPSIVRIVINVFSSLIIIVYGSEHALANGIIVVFGELLIYILCRYLGHICISDARLLCHYVQIPQHYYLFKFMYSVVPSNRTIYPEAPIQNLCRNR